MRKYAVFFANKVSQLFFFTRDWVTITRDLYFRKKMNDSIFFNYNFSEKIRSWNSLDHWNNFRHIEIIEILLSDFCFPEIRNWMFSNINMKTIMGDQDHHHHLFVKKNKNERNNRHILVWSAGAIIDAGLVETEVGGHLEPDRGIFNRWHTICGATAPWPPSPNQPIVIAFAITFAM